MRTVSRYIAGSPPRCPVDLRDILFSLPRRVRVNRADHARSRQSRPRMRRPRRGRAWRNLQKTTCPTPERLAERRIGEGLVPVDQTRVTWVLTGNRRTFETIDRALACSSKPVGLRQQEQGLCPDRTITFFLLRHEHISIRSPCFFRDSTFAEFTNILIVPDDGCPRTKWDRLRSPEIKLCDLPLTNLAFPHFQCFPCGVRKDRQACKLSSVRRLLLIWALISTDIFQSMADQRTFCFWAIFAPPSRLHASWRKSAHWSVTRDQGLTRLDPLRRDLGCPV